MNASPEDILARDAPAAVMGILNVTPDSFSDGGSFLDPSAALAQARQMLEAGAAFLDIGPESTRPGSERVPAGEQIRRIEPLLGELVHHSRQAGAWLSIDTTSAEVARFALDAGVGIINDVSAGRDDPDMLPLAAERDVPVVLMHMLGEPKTMQANPHYSNVVAEVREFLEERLAAAQAVGLSLHRCIVDPGIGFGKRLVDNLALLRQVEAFCSLDVTVLVGPSRKRFIGEITGEQDASCRLGGTIAACLVALAGGARIFRVHDVTPVLQALRVAEALGWDQPEK